jgi:hypothetical protein
MLPVAPAEQIQQILLQLLLQVPVLAECMDQLAAQQLQIQAPAALVVLAALVVHRLVVQVVLAS